MSIDQKLLGLGRFDQSQMGTEVVGEEQSKVLKKLLILVIRRVVSFLEV
mgnify:CR=1 FL=1